MAGDEVPVLGRVIDDRLEYMQWLLSMYESFYGLTEKPFSIIPNPKYLYRSEKHSHALTYLEYGLQEGMGFILLTGEIGTGKTTLVRHLLNKIGSKRDIAVIFNTHVSPGELLGLILQEFELTPKLGDKVANLDTLYHFLIKEYKQNRDPILIIDEAQNLNREVLEEVRMLSNLQTDDKSLLQIMLVGQPELKAKLEDPSLAQLNQRIAVNYHLTELSEQETSEYIASRLVRAGGSAEIFTAEALSKIFEMSRGVPRIINMLCDTALVYGFADELHEISAATIELVVKDRGGLGLLFGEQSTKAQQVAGRSQTLSLQDLRDTEQFQQLQQRYDGLLALFHAYENSMGEKIALLEKKVAFLYAEQIRLKAPEGLPDRKLSTGFFDFFKNLRIY